MIENSSTFKYLLQGTNGFKGVPGPKGDLVKYLHYNHKNVLHCVLIKNPVDRSSTLICSITGLSFGSKAFTKELKTVELQIAYNTTPILKFSSFFVRNNNIFC